MEKENAIIINGVRYDFVEDKNALCDECALEYDCSFYDDPICGIFAIDERDNHMIFKERKNK